MSDNPFPSSTMKERLSLAYIQAVAARAGFEALETRVDIDSVDGILRSTIGRRPQIDFQAKATSTMGLLKADYIAYPLKLKNYNELRAETINPRILIIVVLPPDEINWMSHTEDELVMRRCGYWISLFGSPTTDNETSVTVKVPRTQLFNVDQLKALMARAQIGPVL